MNIRRLSLRTRAIIGATLLFVGSLVVLHARSFRPNPVDPPGEPSLAWVLLEDDIPGMQRLLEGDLYTDSSSLMPFLENAAEAGAPGIFQMLRARMPREAFTSEVRARIVGGLCSSPPIEIWAGATDGKEGRSESENGSMAFARWFKQVRRIEKVKARMLESLIKEGWSTLEADADGLKPIHLAALHANVDAVRRLASLGADLNEPLPDLDAPPPPEPLSGPATAAWYRGKSRQHLRERIRGCAALELAIAGRALLANPMAAIGRGERGVFFSAEQQVETIQTLLSLGAKLPKPDPKRPSILMLAADSLVSRHVRMIEPGAAPADEPRLGKPACGLQVLNLLIKHGANPAEIRGQGYTALMAAAAAGFSQGVQLLAPLTPRALVFKGIDGRAVAFDSHYEALRTAIASPWPEAALALLEPGLPVFQPGVLEIEEDGSLGALALAAGHAPWLLESLLALDTDPTHHQLRLDWRLTGALKSWRTGGLQPVHKALEAGGKPRLETGFEWSTCNAWASGDTGLADTVLIRLLQDGPPLRPEDSRQLLHHTLHLPAIRQKPVLTVLLKQAGPLRSWAEPLDTLRQVRLNGDVAAYDHVMSLFGVLSPKESHPEFEECLREKRVELMTLWLQKGLNPFQRSGEGAGASSPARQAWEAEGESMECLVKAMKAVGRFQGRPFVAFLLEDLKQPCIPSHLAWGGLAVRIRLLRDAGESLAELKSLPLNTRAIRPKDPLKSFYAHVNQHPDLYRVLAEQGLNLNKSFEGCPFLEGYLSYRHVWVGSDEGIPWDAALVKAVLEQGASPFHVWGDGAVLHHAAGGGDPELLKVIIAAGAKIGEAHRKGGMTPLMWAARAGNARTTQWLLEHGASAGDLTGDGWNALGLAQYNDQNGSHQKVIQLLASRGPARQGTKVLAPQG